MLIQCPACQVPVMESAETGHAKGVCPKCNYSYASVTGKLTKRYSKQNTIQRKTTKQRGIYKRDYELRIDTADGGREIFEFQIDGKADTVKVRRGDQVTILATMRGGRVEEVLYVHDHTTGEHFELSTPGAKTRVAAGCTALVIGPVATVAVLVTESWSPMVALAIGAVVGTLAYLAIERSLSPRVALDGGHQRALDTDMGIRVKKEELLSGRAEYLASIHDLESLGKKMRDLLEKMESVGEDAYSSRILSLRQALPMLESLIDAEQQLLAEYDTAITIVEIEQGSMSVAEDVSDGALAGLDDRLERINQARSLNEDKLRELRALEEVEKLLRS